MAAKAPSHTTVARAEPRAPIAIATANTGPVTSSNTTAVPLAEPILADGPLRKLPNAVRPAAPPETNRSTPDSHSDPVGILRRPETAGAVDSVFIGDRGT